MLRLKDFGLVKEKIDLEHIDLDPDGEMYSIPLKRPYDMYVQHAEYYNFDELCLYVSVDLIKTSIIAVKGEEIHIITWNPTVIEQNIIKSLLGDLYYDRY